MEVIDDRIVASEKVFPDDLGISGFVVDVVEIGDDDRQGALLQRGVAML